MDIIFEKKLSAKDRRNMSDVKFGLPSQKKYPLNDEEHVRKAIQFFKFCPQKDRAELANNINKKIKEFDMTVNVSEDNPFYKYVNKSTVKESIIRTDLSIYCPECRSVISENVRNVRKIVFIDKNFDNVDPINKLQMECHKAIQQLLKCDCAERDMAIDYINNITDAQIRSYGYYKDYENNTLNESSYEFDILLAFTDSIVESYDSFEGSKILEELNHDSLLESTINRKYKSNRPDYIMDRHIATNTLESYLKVADKYKLESFMEYTKQTAKDRIENEIYIIDTHNNRNGGVPVIDLSRLESWTNKNNINFTNLNKTDIFKFENINSIESVREANDINGQSVYIATDRKDGSTYLLGVTESNVKLVKIDESLEDYFSGILSDTKFDIKTITFNAKSITNNLLTDTIRSIKEGFSVDEDGNVKISISPKQSYMDEYSQNHKLLVENWKNKNYEGVKTNLAFAFTLIGVIERDKRFKEKDPEVIKARAFAMNDFKTYLKKLQSVEKDFDFTDYYVKNKFDKKIIDIPKSTIVGVKQLLKTILV